MGGVCVGGGEWGWGSGGVRLTGALEFTFFFPLISVIHLPHLPAVIMATFSTPELAAPLIVLSNPPTEWQQQDIVVREGGNFLFFFSKVLRLAKCQP